MRRLRFPALFVVAAAVGLGAGGQTSLVVQGDYLVEYAAGGD